MHWTHFQTQHYSHSLKKLPDGGWYWHLFFDGERINGGLASSERSCHDAIREYRFQHQKAQFVEQYVWDEESREWISRADLSIL